MSNYESAMAEPLRDSGPGAVSQLVEQLERLHHQIALLEDSLAPVLRSLGPEKTVDSVPNIQSPIEQTIHSTAEAVERIIRLRDRLVV